MSGILRLESLTKGNTLKQGDKTPLKYRLFDADGENLNIAGKSAKVKLVYPDFLTIGYEKDGLTVAQDDTVTFMIDKVIPAKLYHVEIIVDGQFIFPSRSDESKFTVDKSSLGTEANIIEIVGVDAVARKATGMMKQDEKFIDDLTENVISDSKVQSFAQGINAKATNALSLSESADTLSKSVQEQFNQVVIDGDSSVEAAQARVGADGEVNATLKARLDKEHNEVTAQLAQTKGLREITYITPYDFGAIGNNIADDTEALRLALWASHTSGVVLFFPSGCKCRVTQPLNYINDTFQNLRLNIVGSTPSGTWLYALEEHGGIRLDAKASLFKSGRISGSIKNMSIVGKRDVDYHFFESCTLSGALILENTISNFSSFTYDSDIFGVSRIELNTFLTIFNFFKHKSIGRTITDSFITGNYINGGQEPTDNVCFAFADGNGSVVQGNFIDYYHTIYKPPIAQTIQLPTSIGNQYQVFLYFYDLLSFVSTVTFLSSGDTFNWTDKTKLEHLNKYEERSITSDDGVARIVPTYIFNPKQSSTIVIENAKIESAVGNVVYIHATINQHARGQSRASFLGVDRYSQNQITYLDGDKPYYNAGSYLQSMIEPFFIIDVEQLPTLALGWSKYPAGARVRCNHQNYRLINKYSPSLSKYVPTWIETDNI